MIELKTRTLEDINFDFGGFDLTPNVSAPIEYNGDKLDKINTIISEAESRPTFDVENELLMQLKSQRNSLGLSMKYLKLDPSFLSMSAELNLTNGDTILVPKFGVFAIGTWAGKGVIRDFSIGYNCKAPDRTKEIPICFPGYLRRLFTDSLIKSTELYKERTQKLEPSDRINNANNIEYNFPLKILPKPIRKKYRGYRGYNGLFLKTKLSTILPNHIAQRIREVEPYLSLNLIAEVKPSEWVQSRPKIDPLLVGVYKEKCYLLDKFDCTPMEEYVSKEFTSH